jgi:hypothetical protein
LAILLPHDITAIFFLLLLYHDQEHVFADFVVEKNEGGKKSGHVSCSSHAMPQIENAGESFFSTWKRPPWTIISKLLQ